jgi:hypothetical protein
MTMNMSESIEKGHRAPDLFLKNVFLKMSAHMFALLSCKIYANIWDNTHISEHITMNLSESIEKDIGLRTYF